MRPSNVIRIDFIFSGQGSRGFAEGGTERLQLCLTSVREDSHVKARFTEAHDQEGALSIDGGDTRPSTTVPRNLQFETLYPTTSTVFLLRPQGHIGGQSSQSIKSVRRLGQMSFRVVL